jgi:predicted nicotinamide N-methyase
MKRLTEFNRCKRLIESIISDLKLDLQGMRVLTETGSGAFVLTPIIAALAGAESVVAVTADSSYGTARDVKKYTETWIERFGVTDTVQVSYQSAKYHAPDVDLVTNLGFVRPINAELLALLPENAVVSLMWEPWEYRSEDLDLPGCQRHNIPVLGTDEQDERLQIFKYVGMLAVKLIFEAGLELFRSRVIVIGSGVFGKETVMAMKQNGAQVIHYDPEREWPLPPDRVSEDLAVADVIVVVENQCSRELIGTSGGIEPKVLINGARLVHICGNIDDSALLAAGISKWPERAIEPGYMTVTTDYLGPRPVIDLHAAGLKVGESLVRGMRKFGRAEQAVGYALDNSPSLNFPGY